MLHSLIVASKSRDTTAPAGDPAASRPLNARSLALSALLGTHPPTLTAGALVSLAELFAINGGTMRTALSRMAGAGDVVVDDAHYSLAPRLVARQAAQDAGRRRAIDTAWSGDWHVAVAVADQRALADRRHLRVIMANARFGELRPSVWMRPANLPAPVLGPDLEAEWLVTTGPAAGADPVELTARLWDLDALARTASDLDRRLADADAGIDHDDPAEIPAAFVLSAEVLRFLRTEPILPTALTPDDWPVDPLRDRYERFERGLQAMLRPFLRRSEQIDG
jgi:phenylacetic acid degradation operon negative regulatory protein